MKAIKKLLDTTPKIIGAVVVLLLLIFWGVLFVVATPFAIALVKPIGIAVVVLVLAWVGIHFGVKAWRKRKRKNLDDAIAAKEGIADRKREWNDWVEELEKRDIDRYELPFYLLVGEPQSGKSVLLHNSDLHFPFGQNRLSGVGGTRGCDWWFTEEAVILDLAGRLFTHEGGASDRLEFEAFLDLLREFRPLCPANGVILVVPCDSLLKDAPEAAQAKAIKIQNALASLSAKLQAQLPVYLVLTKGDQIFGFAESVHRLDVEHRHQMFGWSRPATKIDAPFDTKEALQGFDSLVARSRLLRGHMLAGARLPEALPEVDRMFAFPHELGGMRANLETYLARVFTESGATERVFFRGLYLTSGLQSGVPIAKVCSELYGQTGEADKRDLEALFSKPKAYFIKDLVRTRIFGERGLVRPTQGRVKNTRRTSAIAYGIAGTLVLLSLLFATVYLAKGTGDEALATRQAAIAAARTSAEATSPDAQQLLRALGAIDAAIELPEASTETAFGGAKEEFQHLFRTLFDERLAPELQRLAAFETERRFAANDFADHADLVRCVRAAQVLVNGVDLAREDDAQHLIGGLPPELRVDAPRSGGSAVSAAQAVRVRRTLGEEERLRLVSLLDTQASALLADRALGALQSCTEPGSDVQPSGELGFLVAWLGVAGALSEFEDPAPSEEDVRVLMRQLGRARQSMDTIHAAALGGQSSIALLTIFNQEEALIALRDDLAKAIERLTGAPTTRPPWTDLTHVHGFAKALAENNDLATLEAWDLTSPSSGDVALTLTGLVSDKLSAAAAKLTLKQPRQLFDSVTDAGSYFDLATRPVPLLDQPNALVGLAQCLRDIEAILLRLQPATANKARVLYTDQCIAAATEFQKDFATTLAVHRGLGLPDVLPAGELSHVFVSELADLHVVLGGVVQRDGTPDNVVTILQAWRESIERQLFEHIAAVKSITPLVRPVTSAATFDDETWRLLRALATVARLDVVRADRYPVHRTGATLLGDLYFRQAEELERLWSSRTAERIGSTIQLATELSAFCTRTKTDLGGFDVLKASGPYEAFGLRLDGLVADRLRSAVAEVHLEWSAELGDTSVALAASNALEILGSVPQRVRNSEAKELNRLREITAEFGDASSIREFLPGMAESLPLVTELDRCRLPAASGMEADPNYRTLKDTLQKLTSLLPTEATYGESLAQAYVQGFTAKSLVDPSGPSNSGLRLVMETKREFARVLGTAIRAEYLNSLENELTSARYSTLFDTLFWTPPTTPTGADKVPDSLVRDQLTGFIDRDRAFDALRKKFRLIGADAIASDLFPEGAQLEDPWAAVHVFLADLQSFLLGLDLAEGGVKRVTEMRFRFVLVPRTSESGSIWDLASTPVPEQRAFFYFPANDSANTLQRVPMNSPGRPAVTNWGFDVTNDSRALRLVWSTATKQDEAAIDADRYHATIPTCIGPLLMAWSGSRLDPTDGLRYRLTLKPIGSERVAPFDIEFDRPLPVRPARP